MNIVALHIAKRSLSAAKVQAILTEYGCHIKTRIGFHHTAEDSCAEDGIIILQIAGGKDVSDKLLKNLVALEGIQAKYVDFS